LSAVVTTFNDLPCFFDETTNLKEDVKKYLGYLVSNGQEPLRGTRDAKMRASGKIRSNVLLTGEADFISKLANDGAHTRVTVLASRPIPKLEDPKPIWEARDGMCQNYGHILKPFLQIINMHRSDLANWYRVAQHRLASSTTDDKQKRKSAYFAAAEVSGKLLEEVYGRIGLGKTDAQKIVQDVWNECVLGSPDVPLAIRMLWDLNDYIESNRFHTLHRRWRSN
jgi:uncharacterized protein (DUF927 family)